MAAKVGRDDVVTAYQLGAANHCIPTVGRVDCVEPHRGMQCSTDRRRDIDGTVEEGSRGPTDQLLLSKMVAGTNI